MGKVKRQGIVSVKCLAFCTIKQTQGRIEFALPTILGQIRARDVSPLRETRLGSPLKNGKVFFFSNSMPT